ncbi:MAG: phage antirepressor KilAC domain-containing protein [Haemophilus parainfluenzae]|nr:phage antirepressor KilAC domain-containing protein [Haemophilus parainfluenzae]
MNQLIVIDNTKIKQDSQGRYCLNDLHRVSGGNPIHAPSQFLRLKGTKDFVSVLDNHNANLHSALEIINGGTNQGCYAAEKLVYKYAAWINPEFEVKVYDTFDKVVKGKLQPNQTALIPQSFSEALMLAAQLQAEKEQNAPKVEAFDRLATATEGAMNLTNAAKHLQMQPRAFNQFLFANGWIYKRTVGSAWIAYQDKLQRGYLEHKAHPVTQPDGTEKIYPQVLVTAKGLAKLSTMLNKAAA